MPESLLYLLPPIHIASTGIMAGVIWFVQRIHYPWLDRVPPEQFTTHHQAYTARVGMIVGPAMLVEAASGLLWWYGSSGSAHALLTISLALLALIWVSTFCVQVPCHNRLAKQYEADTHQRLVRTNWVRTMAWSVRLILAILAAATLQP